MPISSPFGSWARYVRPRTGVRVRLFCFPYAGGSASIYRSWVENLSEEIELVAVQLPGRENRLREAPFTAMFPLIEALMSVLRPHMDVPFAFFGHCMGALIGFELAHQLRREQAPLPACLFVSGCRGPQLHHLNVPTYQLPDTEFMEAMGKFNGISETLLNNEELIPFILPSLRSDSTIFDLYTYQPEGVLPCAISAFGGLQDKEHPQEQIVHWREQTSGEFTLRMLPGDHFFLSNERDYILRAIEQDLVPWRGC